MQHINLDKYRSAIRNFDGNATSAALRMASEGGLSVHYSPFEWVNRDARLVLVGITPGKTQAVNALNEAKRQLSQGAPDDEVLKRAKATGAFSGSMRPYLVDMLDHIGIAKWLGLPSCAQLFGEAAHLLQTASVLQFPVFVDGDNYNGSPDILKSPLLKKMLLDHFGQLPAMLPQAVFVPLGPVATKVVCWLAERGAVNPRRVLAGLPHPSPANAERIHYFLGRKPIEQLSVKTDPRKLDGARRQLLTAVAAL
jgi:hypothetical protein